MGSTVGSRRRVRVAGKPSDEPLRKGETQSPTELELSQGESVRLSPSRIRWVQSNEASNGSVSPPVCPSGDRSDVLFTVSSFRWQPLTQTLGGRNYRPSISRAHSIGIIIILARSFVTIVNLPSFASPGVSFRRKREVPQSSAARPSTASVDFAHASASVPGKGSSRDEWDGGSIRGNQRSLRLGTGCQLVCDRTS